MRTALLLIFLLGFSQIANAQSSDQTLLSDIPVAICKPGLCSVTMESPETAMAGMGSSDQVSGFFTSLLDTSQWPDRWHCGVWTPFHGWLYILSDFFIWISYFAIPIILGFFIYKKKVESIPFKGVLILFIAFILACGLTHLMDASIFWWPAYRLSALLRFVTAAVSLFTVFSLIKVIPSVLELKSPAFLEKQVEERTNALIRVNEQLNAEMYERKKAADQLKTANDELVAFSYSVSHDLRAPLRSIQGFSQAMFEDCSGNLDKDGMDYLTRISSAGSRMAELIEDILKLSRISRDQLIAEDVDLSEMVQEVVSECIHRRSDVKTTFEIETGIHTKADRKLLKIAIENLVDNAIKYSSKQETSLVAFGKVPGENTFFLKDNGVGFDMQFSDKLFGAFQRLHHGGFDGSGIGLATVKRIISRHGGNVWADAKLNEGATFYFTMN